MIDEGYTKYRCHWERSALLPLDDISELNVWRNRLHEAGLIGYDETHEVGYGNISRRLGRSRRFIISGTQTGHIAHADARHYAVVTDYDIAANRVTCRGPVPASSEALTHAAIYELDPTIGSVVHVHNRALWDRLLHQVSTTAPEVSYGTPEMAREFARLCDEADFCTTGVAAMAGHADGLITFGHTVEHAAGRTLGLG